jgi:hypothetical protein
VTDKDRKPDCFDNMEALRASGEAIAKRARGEAPKLRARNGRIVFLDEEGSKRNDLYWAGVPDWVACRLTARKSAAAWACALALGRIVRRRGGQNPVAFYEPEPDGCDLSRHMKARGLRELVALDLAQVADAGRGKAAVVRCLWLPEG